ncbi:Hypothetical Protein FCC1311_024482 [Hondaea fermentalgiana]|uniref:Uncharacterized protein n=1 Tax=Hondaea fermentalgiana TaxID=2315210 RepID=A0A2R5G5B7_9STRA|nr:Hypothetical Protein FCC1311_024482 [Hondaea fermentalgiana]|eukprot:GBG26227.1 Hypothetical Protein FCC1311_024482 [Hondaea fermentalgiana]
MFKARPPSTPYRGVKPAKEDESEQDDEHIEGHEEGEVNETNQEPEKRSGFKLFKARPPSTPYDGLDMRKKPSARKSSALNIFKARPPSGPYADEDPLTHNPRFKPKLFRARPPSAAFPADEEFGLPVATLEDDSDDEDEGRASKNMKKPNVAIRMKTRVTKQIRKKHACERAFMCALAVSLLWLTSLVVAKEVTYYFIPTPTEASVEYSVEQSVQVTKDQRVAYEECATEVLASCEATFTRDDTAELERIQIIQEAIAEELERIKDEIVACSIAFINATDWLDAATTAGAIDSSNVITSGPAICESTDLSEFITSEALAADAVSQVENYQSEADEQINSLYDSIYARSAYNTEFMDNLTNGQFSEISSSLTSNLTSASDVIDAVDTLFSDFMACVSLDSSYEKQDGTTVQCDSTSVFGQARSQFEEMENTYQSLLEEARSFRESIEAKMARYQELYDLVTQIVGVFSAGGISINLYLSTVDLGFTDYLESLVGDAFDSLSNLIPDPEEIYDDMVAQAESFMDDMFGEGSLIEISNALYEGNATALTTTIFDDYDPPYVNETLYEEQQAASAAVVSDVASELDSVTSEENGTSILDDFVETVGTNISEAAATLLDKADPREWSSFFSYSDDIFNQFSTGITNANDLALAFDYAYRIIYSFMLIRKYWNISAINTPPADVRTKAGIKAGTFQVKTNMMQKAGKLLASPALAIFIILLFLCLFGYAFYYAYSPIYEEYVNNCVDKCYFDIQNTIRDDDGNLRYDAQAEGTMLYRNAYVIAQQYAFSDGDYVASTEVDSLGVTMELSCSNRTITSIQSQSNEDDKLDYYNTRADSLIPKFEYLRTCVDTAAIRDAHPEYDFSELISDSTLPECVRNFSSFETFLETASLTVLQLDRTYDCNNIAACDFECSGPNEAILRGVTFNTACTSEWYAHAELLCFFCAILGYITSNLARLIFLNGIVKVSWRHLSSHRFALIASCREDGSIVYPEEVTEKGESFRKVIVRQLRIAIRAFERRGCLITLFGIAVVIPWIAILIALNRNLGFDSEKYCET